MAPDGALSREVALRKESVDRNFVYTRVEQPRQVALRKESVDRNVWRGLGQRPRLAVALRKESVDRNKKMGYADRLKLVALRKESVDRNYRVREGQQYRHQSLSARRAWIEILVEGQYFRIIGSLSARRAWIEIIGYSSVMLNTAPVALRKESVDRNVCSHLRKQFHFCRSPQGERG